WNEAEAVDLILCGCRPRTVLARASSVTKHWDRSQDSVQLEIDPSLSPARVAQIYLEARRKLRSVDQRRLSERHAEMGGVATQVNDGRSWDAALAEWNARFPKWRVDRVETFTRDSRKAFSRLMQRPIAWAGKKGRPRGSGVRDSVRTQLNDADRLHTDLR